ncbi:DNA adenine methylase [Pectobacterium sp. CHL-2024]|uniref:DNA adenine methylase n=1 Tax=Pectobacterium sp. CHL-2024 TaxID=3377079 RepID=UPI00382B1868
MAHFSTPLRYPGGKARLGMWLGELFDYNEFSNFTYVEPFAGGAGAAIYLLLKNKVNDIIINDADLAIYSFWYSMLNNTEHFINKIESTEISIESWFKCKEIYSNPNKHDLLSLGFSTFFLNRTNRSGILKAGVIGGKEQSGRYKIDARFNKRNLINRIRTISERKKSISVYNLDCVEFIGEIHKFVKKNPIFYFDPPYYSKGSQLYKNFYAHNDHIEVSNILKNLDHPWLLTYDLCAPITEMYEGINSERFNFHYSTHLNRPVASEVLFYKNILLKTPPYMTRK